MEHDTVSPPDKKWKRDDIIGLFQKGVPYEEIKRMTGLPAKVLAGYKGYVHSPAYEGPPIPPPGVSSRGMDVQPSSAGEEVGGHGPSEPNGKERAGEGTQPGEPGLDLAVGPTETQALTILQGKPYLVQARNIYVNPGVLACYQISVAKGYKGSLGEFMGDCVLKLFRHRYNLIPGMISPPQEGPQ